MARRGDQESLQRRHLVSRRRAASRGAAKCGDAIRRRCRVRVPVAAAREWKVEFFKTDDRKIIVLEARTRARVKRRARVGEEKPRDTNMCQRVPGFGRSAFLVVDSKSSPPALRPQLVERWRGGLETAFHKIKVRARKVTDTQLRAFVASQKRFVKSATGRSRAANAVVHERRPSARRSFHPPKRHARPPATSLLCKRLFCRGSHSSPRAHRPVKGLDG